MAMQGNCDVICTTLNVVYFIYNNYEHQGNVPDILKVNVTVDLKS